MEKDSKADGIGACIVAHDIRYATTHLARLVDNVAREKTSVVITRAGRPVARIVPFAAPSKGKRRGFLADKGFTFNATAFSARDAEISEQFMGNE